LSALGHVKTGGKPAMVCKANLDVLGIAEDSVPYRKRANKLPKTLLAFSEILTVGFVAHLRMTVGCANKPPFYCYPERANKGESRDLGRGKKPRAYDPHKQNTNKIQTKQKPLSPKLAPGKKRLFL